MNCLSIQLQTEINQDVSWKDVINLFSSIQRYPEMEVDEECSSHINLHFFSDDVERLWRDIQEVLNTNEVILAGFNKIAIVVCENDFEEGESLLLFHYNDSESLDTF